MVINKHAQVDWIPILNVGEEVRSNFCDGQTVGQDEAHISPAEGDEHNNYCK